MSLFSSVEQAPADPILGLTEAFVADTRPTKVNLGVGVYLDAAGKVPLLECVKVAEASLAQAGRPRSYLPIDGMPAYVAALKELVFDGSDVVSEGRVVTVQALGGTGGLRIGAGLLQLSNPGATVLVSNPSWENHQALFTRAGFPVATYRYYDAANRRVDVDGMVADLEAAAPGTIVVLLARCHNPTGYELAPADWDRVIATLDAGRLVPYLDMAYQGFAEGLAEDSYVVRKVIDAGLSFLVATSFSKSFSLYGERVGGLSVVTADAADAKRVLSQIKVIIRTLYSSPATHGAAIVAHVLADPELRALWEQELAGMRDRIKAMRSGLVAGLAAAGVTEDMSFITDQVGMFSYSGLTRDQMLRLRSEFGVYGTDSGRLCIAALNDGNLGYVSDAIAAVLR
ncbi:MAG: aspartate/tyrosine/aromatic aminotransferase [Actinobacteria bacterium]|nr:aspartate/tyrosine/aromatic aminotransferase [Actinomycetota bacterium]